MRNVTNFKLSTEELSYSSVQRLVETFDGFAGEGTTSMIISMKIVKTYLSIRESKIK